MVEPKFQDDFGHWLSNEGWFFDIDSENEWLNMELMEFSDTRKLYGKYINSKIKSHEKTSTNTGS